MSVCELLYQYKLCIYACIRSNINPESSLKLRNPCSSTEDRKPYFQNPSLYRTSHSQRAARYSMSVPDIAS
eukprot:3941684-Rhodomonas_salina.2